MTTQGTGCVCEDCRQRGSQTMTIYPTVYRKQGRRDQGAMTSTWVAASYCPILKRTLCPTCWKQRFYARRCTTAGAGA